MTHQQFTSIKPLAVKKAGMNVILDYVTEALSHAQNGAVGVEGTSMLVSSLRLALQLAHARLEGFQEQ